MYQKVEADFHGRRLSIETGRVAKQAGGAVLVQFGDRSSWSRPPQADRHGRESTSFR